MNLTVDIGNTNIKYAFFENGNLVKLGNSIDLQELQHLLNDSAFENCLISSVKYTKGEVLDGLTGAMNVAFLDNDTQVPIQVNYDTPETLGMDRLAAVVGGQGIFPDHPIMVIDIGTCITYDLLDADSIYQGGAISPGLDLKFKAVHDYTARLPLIADWGDADIFGKNTYDSVKSGVINGTAAEMNGMISQFMLKIPDLKVIITGGGVKTFESKIKADIFVALEIVLVGLNRVLEYNAQKF